MKKSIQALIAVLAFGASGIMAQAQPAPKIVVVDMAKLLDGYYKSQEQTAKLQSDEQKAQQELDQMNKDGNDLVDQYKAIIDQTKNPMITADARTKAEADAQKKMEEIQRKKQDVQSFAANVQRSIQQRVQNFRSLFLDEISKAAIVIAQQHGATLVLDKSGPSLLGIPGVIYSDGAYDITDEVMAVINKGHPTTPPASATAAAPAPGATAPASTDTPKITLPNLGGGK